MDATKSKPILRFAPSPTGLLHVGGARTAIFNWLVARHFGGTYLLRIEDTDQVRSTDAARQQILNALTWLGLDWDDDVYYQSKHIQRHKDDARQLLEQGKAYRCFCTKDELDQKRRIAEEQKINQRYDGTCRQLTKQQIESNQQSGKPFTLRFKVDTGQVHFEDKILGSITTDNETLDDFIILRSDGSPIYQLAVVSDDHHMGVNLVLRGQDHIANTNKQILLYRALGWSVPEFGHIPLILGPDKIRLSKRHGAASVEEFRDQGILSDALFNYLCLLGWSPGDDREMMPRDEIINLFSLDQANRAPAVFDEQKLLWMNSKWIAELDSAQLQKVAQEWLTDNDKILNEEDMDRFRYFVGLLQPRSKTMKDLKAGISLFFDIPEMYEEKGVKKYFRKEGAFELLAGLNAEFKQHNGRFYSDQQKIEAFIRDYAEKLELSAGKLIHPLRLALTGSTASPGIFELIYVLGKEKVIERLERALSYIGME